MQQEQTLKILSDLTKKDIEKIYKTKAYYSQRYGWTLRRTVLPVTSTSNPSTNR
jgi:hypothetical protein|tara:strand:- start:1575 stop:1736 length:162 start_codon:yes stop_codon:yes gene_type:complete